MKKLELILMVILTLLLSNKLPAVYQTAFRFLTISPSPALNGAAGTFVALPAFDTFAFYYNPAQIGNFSREKNVAVSIYPKRTDWLPGVSGLDLFYTSHALALGYDMKKINPSLPVFLGFGYMYTLFDLGKYYLTDQYGNTIDVFDAFETCHAFSVGIGFDYYMQMNFGFTFKYIYSYLSPERRLGDQVLYGPVKKAAMDFGILLNIPLLDFFNADRDAKIFGFGRYFPVINYSLGYGLSNYGGEVAYMSGVPPDPMPRTARAGHGLLLGIREEHDRYSLNVITLQLSVEAHDLLIQGTADGFKYESITGKMKIMHNIIRAKADDFIEIHSGLNITIYDAISLQFGKTEGPGIADCIRTRGLILSTKGILNLLKGNSNNEQLKYIAGHFELQFAISNYDTDNEGYDETGFMGISLIAEGF